MKMKIGESSSQIGPETTQLGRPCCRPPYLSSNHAKPQTTKPRTKPRKPGTKPPNRWFGLVNHKNHQPRGALRKGINSPATRLRALYALTQNARMANRISDRAGQTLIQIETN